MMSFSNQGKHGKRQVNEHKLTPDDVEFLLNALRQASIKWSGRNLCLKKARKKVLERTAKNGKPIYKFYWKCAICKNWERDEKNMEVDHIVEIGPFQGSFDVHIPRIFCSQSNLQAVCLSCHMKKTLAYNNARHRWKRKPKL